MVLSPSHAHNAGPARGIKTPEYFSPLAKQLYDLAAIANGPLKTDEMAVFIRRSNEMMLLVAEE